MNICLVCLRTDKFLKLNLRLAEFHSELCSLSLDVSNILYCNECEYLLTKFYKFKQKCHQASEIFNNWMCEAAGITPIETLQNKLPPSNMDVWTQNPSHIAYFKVTYNARGKSKLNPVPERSAILQEVINNAKRKREEIDRFGNNVDGDVGDGTEHEDGKTVRSNKRQRGLKNRQWRCNVCNVTMSKVSDIESHIAENHPEANKKSFYMNGMTYICELCGATYKKRSSLRYHMTDHAEARPSNSNLCPKTSTDNMDMKSDSMVHVPPAFPCSACDKKFVAQWKLYAHFKRVHKKEPADKKQTDSKTGNKTKRKINEDSKKNNRSQKRRKKSVTGVEENENGTDAETQDIETINAVAAIESNRNQ